MRIIWSNYKYKKAFGIVDDVVKKPITIDIKDFEDSRIVTFLSNGNVSYILFRRDKKGDFKFSRSETSNGKSFEIFVVDLFGEENRVLIVSIKNKYSEIDKFSFKANGIEYNVSFETSDAETQWNLLDLSADGHYKIEWE